MEHEQRTLLPCPFCGADGGGFHLQACQTHGLDGAPRDWTVECDVCAGFGPSKSTRAQAEAAWNARTVAPTGDAALIVQWIVELARRDIARTSTDFVGRMQEAMSEYERICDEYPDGHWPEHERDAGGEALAGLAGLALAQLAMVSNAAEPLAALASPASEVGAVPADDDDPCAGGAHCCCCGPGEPCCDCGQIMPTPAAPCDVPAGALPKLIGRLHLGDRRSDGERLCSRSHPVPAGHPLYWPERMGEYPDDVDPLCLAHAIEQAESDQGWCETCTARELAAAPCDVPAGCAIGDVAAERRRQAEKLGWTPEHDDSHDRDGALPRAAACYALVDHTQGQTGPFFITHLQTPRQVWPGRWEWKPKDRRTNLVRAAALLVAEIERLDRAAPQPPAQPEGENSRG